MTSCSAILSIGVYGFSEDAFFQALQNAQVDCFCDVRARRGLRGPKYAFANSTRLQLRLQSIGIQYLHLKQFAPSAAVRDAQKNEDARLGIAKRKRSKLGEAFKSKYQQENLIELNARELLNHELQGVSRPVFFCVEKEPAACHRSLLTEELAKQTGLPVEHLMP